MTAFNIKEFLPDETDQFYLDFGNLDFQKLNISLYEVGGVIHLDDNELKLKKIHCEIPGQVDYHTKYFFKNSIHKENIAKAVGIKKGDARPVLIDLTAGLLGDSILLSLYCEKITGYERHPLIYALSKSALLANPMNIELIYGEYNNKGQTLFYDPMYNDPNKKTAPKKEMQLFRKLIGSDSDCSGFVNKLEFQRLVIKRPIKSEMILIGPSMQYKGKSTRYDVYLTPLINKE
jgi:hypothetical protein